MSRIDPLQIGAGAGYAGDRIEPAVELAAHPPLDYLVFECLAERTIALAQLDRTRNPAGGYTPLLEERMQRVLPHCVANDTAIVTNMGAANPEAAAEAARSVATELGYPELTVASVSGCDVVDAFDHLHDTTFAGDPTAAYEDRAVSANAYLGVDGIVDALQRGVDVVVTGRVADMSLFLAPMVFEFGWDLDPLTEPAVVGQGIAAAHLIECAGQVTGGYFADPGYKDVDGLDELGFPIAEVGPRGDVIITKLPESGGQVTERTCKEQILYEIHDPSDYLTPDAAADFSEIRFEEVGRDRVEVTGASAGPRPETLKVSIGYEESVVGEGEIGYAGPGALERARLGADIVRSRLDQRDVDVRDLQVDCIGLDSFHGEFGRRRGSDPYEVRLRIAGKCPSEAEAKQIGHEVETLYTNGPSAGGGVIRRTTPKIGVVSTLVDREHVTPTVTMAGESNAS